MQQYTVQAGDTPWSLAERYTGRSTRWGELVGANPHKPRARDGNFARLEPGEVLTLPPGWPSPAHGRTSPAASSARSFVRSSDDAGALPTVAPLPHAEARGIVRDAWRRVLKREATQNETDFAQAIAWLENHYGRHAGQFAALAARGQYNWGSLHCRKAPTADGVCADGCAKGVDEGSVCFRVFTNDVDAASAFIFELTRRAGVVDAMATGSAAEVARVMRATGYYTAPEAAYARAIESSLELVRPRRGPFPYTPPSTFPGSTTTVPRPGRPATPATEGGAGPLVALGIVAALVALTLSRTRGRR